MKTHAAKCAHRPFDKSESNRETVCEEGPGGTPAKAEEKGLNIACNKEKALWWPEPESSATGRELELTPLGEADMEVFIEFRAHRSARGLSGGALMQC